MDGISSSFSQQLVDFATSDNKIDGTELQALKDSAKSEPENVIISKLENNPGELKVNDLIGEGVAEKNISFVVDSEKLEDTPKKETVKTDDFYKTMMSFVENSYNKSGNFKYSSPDLGNIYKSENIKPGEGYQVKGAGSRKYVKFSDPAKHQMVKDMQSDLKGVSSNIKVDGLIGAETVTMLKTAMSEANSTGNIDNMNKLNSYIENLGLEQIFSVPKLNVLPEVVVTADKKIEEGVKEVVKEVAKEVSEVTEKSYDDRDITHLVDAINISSNDNRAGSVLETKDPSLVAEAMIKADPARVEDIFEQRAKSNPKFYAEVLDKVLDKNQELGTKLFNEIDPSFWGVAKDATIGSGGAGIGLAVVSKLNPFTAVPAVVGSLVYGLTNDDDRQKANLLLEAPQLMSKLPAESIEDAIYFAAKKDPDKFKEAAESLDSGKIATAISSYWTDDSVGVVLEALSPSKAADVIANKSLSDSDAIDMFEERAPNKPKFWGNVLNELDKTDNSALADKLLAEVDGWTFGSTMFSATDAGATAEIKSYRDEGKIQEKDSKIEELAKKVEEQEANSKKQADLLKQYSEQLKKFEEN